MAPREHLLGGVENLDPGGDAFDAEADVHRVHVRLAAGLDRAGGDADRVVDHAQREGRGQNP